MNIQEKRKRLQERLEHNIKHENVGTAIAITGSWGVGKTYFWNKFLKDVTNKEIEDKNNFYYEASKVNYQSIFDCRKYAYISLFGMENLSDLKNAICTKLTLNPYAKKDSNKWEFSTLFKNTVAQFRDMKVSQYGVSASAKILESLLFLQVKDAIICFDDFERMSNKLDIKDVMGLANQLKLEKNCQVILILDEDKAEGENKSKYAEYKEKLIDETIIINSVEPLIREFSQEMDDQLINLMVEFADKLEIHNFRFFQKVIKLYKDFREKLPEIVTYSTKKIILIRILQGYFIEDFGVTYGISWVDMSIEKTLERVFSDEDLTGILKRLKDVSYDFVDVDDYWFIQFKNWFEQRDSTDILMLCKLANSELISENNNLIKEQLDILMNQWRNLEVDSSYCNHLFQKSYESIAFNNLESLDFHCFLLKKFGRNDLSKQLKRAVFAWLINELYADYEHVWDEATTFGYKKENIFHWYIKRWKLNNPSAGFPSLFDILKVYVLEKSIKNKAELVLQHATQQDWEDFIFVQSSTDTLLSNLTKGELMTKILKQNIDKNLTPLIKQNIKAILLTKHNASTDQFQKKNIEFVVENFKKEGLL
ncbi:KAP family P-loop domain protein [Acinetobacter sp. ANC 4470]|uniref:P-loop NTPase fold protein n=1 Tax=Acinetobacter sp. ANC 4470 TaxID=1977881 RepID=UPI000A338B2C|nr:P-loop NTPase fold protein [Acinetobacter sp. ANC 4470]OTG69465.1 KAP family P-loop domain protein [Acinetobacter sp. ANC 4470]